MRQRPVSGDRSGAVCLITCLRTLSYVCRNQVWYPGVPGRTVLAFHPSGICSHLCIGVFPAVKGSDVLVSGRMPSSPLLSLSILGWRKRQAASVWRGSSPYDRDPPPPRPAGDGFVPFLLGRSQSVSHPSHSILSPPPSPASSVCPAAVALLRTSHSFLFWAPLGWNIHLPPCGTLSLIGNKAQPCTQLSTTSSSNHLFSDASGTHRQSCVQALNYGLSGH